MLYCNTNFASKKAFKDAVTAGKQLTCRAMEPYEKVPDNGTAAVGGPWYPQPHKWYATVTFKDGVVVKVK